MANPRRDEIGQRRIINKAFQRDRINLSFISSLCAAATKQQSQLSKRHLDGRDLLSQKKKIALIENSSTIDLNLKRLNFKCISFSFIRRWLNFICRQKSFVRILVAKLS